MKNPRISYVNGRYVRHARAFVHIDDRGYQFADGVYEVIALKNGHMLDENMHFERLIRSLSVLSISLPMSITSIHIIISELKRLNDIKEGHVYIQITRGVAKRDHVFPKIEATPSLVITLNPKKNIDQSIYEDGISVVTTKDIRWKRCDVKSTSLLANVLSKQGAYEKGASEAWMVDEDGYVTEGSSSNCYIVNTTGTLITHPEGKEILGGVTRKVILSLATEHGISVGEKPFSVDDVFEAKEAFASSTTMGVIPVTTVDGRKIAGGKLGKVTRELFMLYKRRAESITK